MNLVWLCLNFFQGTVPFKYPTVPYVPLPNCVLSFSYPQMVLNLSVTLILSFRKRNVHFTITILEWNILTCFLILMKCGLASPADWVSRLIGRVEKGSIWVIWLCDNVNVRVIYFFIINYLSCIPSYIGHLNFTDSLRVGLWFFFSLSRYFINQYLLNLLMVYLALIGWVV